MTPFIQMTQPPLQITSRPLSTRRVLDVLLLSNDLLTDAVKRDTRNVVHRPIHALIALHQRTDLGEHSILVMISVDQQKSHIRRISTFSLETP